MLYTFLAVLVLVAIAFVALGINILFFKKPFPETEISRNKEMHKRGIRCAKSEEMRIFRAQQKRKQSFQQVTLDTERLQVEK